MLELGQDRGASRGISLQATPALPPGVSLQLSRSGRVVWRRERWQVSARDLGDGERAQVVEMCRVEHQAAWQSDL